MINYSYFRHRFDAHQNAKINKLADEIGIEAYAYYYTLIEIYGSHYHKADAGGYVEIHQRIVANVWRKRTDSCTKIMEKLELAGLIVTTKLQLSDHLVTTKLPLSYHLVATKMLSTYTLAIPNFLKYFGSYKKTEHEKTPNKRKEKEIKEKKSIPNQDSVKLDEVEVCDAIAQDVYNDIGALWNEMALLNALPKVKLPLSVDRKKKMAPAVKEFKEYSDWLKIINAVVDNDFNLGINERKWKANFDWLFHSTKFNYRKLWEAHAEENN